MVRGVTTVGIEELRLRAPALVAAAVDGETVTVTNHEGRPLAQITAAPDSAHENVAVPKNRLEELVAAGLVRPPTRDLADLPKPKPGPISLSAAVVEMRRQERY